jgi:hypothetical protein
LSLQLFFHPLESLQTARHPERSCSPHSVSKAVEGPAVVVVLALAVAAAFRAVALARIQARLDPSNPYLRIGAFCHWGYGLFPHGKRFATTTHNAVERGEAQSPTPGVPAKLPLKIFIEILSYFLRRRKGPSTDQLYHAIHHKLTTKAPQQNSAFSKTPLKNTGKSSLSPETPPTIFSRRTNPKSWRGFGSRGHENPSIHPSKHKQVCCSRSDPSASGKTPSRAQNPWYC